MQVYFEFGLKVSFLKGPSHECEGRKGTPCKCSGLTGRFSFRSDMWGNCLKLDILLHSASSPPTKCQTRRLHSQTNTYTKTQFPFQPIHSFVLEKSLQFSLFPLQEIKVQYPLLCVGGNCSPTPKCLLAFCKVDWKPPPLNTPHTWALSSSTLFHPLACSHLIPYLSNMLKPFIYERPSLPVSPLLQTYFFSHSNAVILVELLARGVTTHAHSTILHHSQGGVFFFLMHFFLLKISFLIYIPTA